MAGKSQRIEERNHPAVKFQCVVEAWTNISVVGINVMNYISLFRIRYNALIWCEVGVVA